MIATGIYKLRKVAGRVSHYAKVQLEVHTTDDAVMSAAVPVGPAAWVAAALDGAHEALRHVATRDGPGLQVTLSSCEGTPADTDIDTIWCAAFLASLSALDAVGTASPEFDLAVRRWYVILDDGRRLDPPKDILRQAAHDRIGGNHR